MIARVAAIVVALAMIGGAFAFRYGVPGGDDDGTEGGRDTGPVAAAKVHCAAELGADVCAAAGDDVVVEPAATTAERLLAARSAGAAGIAGWLAPGPWPAMVDDGRRLASRPAMFAKDRVALASTPLVAVSRRGQLPPGCAALTWRCIGDAAQDPAFRIGGERRGTAAGLFARAGALAGYFGNPDFATNDLDDQPDSRTWIDNLDARLAAAPGFGAGSLEGFVLQQGSARAYLTTGAAAAGLAGNEQFEVSTPTPAVRIVAAFTPVASTDAGIDGRAAAQALTGAGWAAARSGASDEGLPSPGVLLALLEVG